MNMAKFPISNFSFAAAHDPRDGHRARRVGDDAHFRREGALVLMGVPEHAHPPPAVGKLLSRRRSISASLIGGIQETQEMLEFCATHGIASDVEVIPIQKINEAYERMLKNDVKYRFVIDMASLKA